MSESPLPHSRYLAGPQVVITRVSPEEPETIERFTTFEAAAAAWRKGSRLIREKGTPSGAYCVWVNDGSLWRRSGLLDDLPAALSIRDRVLVGTERFGR